MVIYQSLEKHGEVTTWLFSKMHFSCSRQWNIRSNIFLFPCPRFFLTNVRRQREKVFFSFLYFPPSRRLGKNPPDYADLHRGMAFNEKNKKSAETSVKGYTYKCIRTLEGRQRCEKRRAKVARESREKDLSRRVGGAESIERKVQRIRVKREGDERRIRELHRRERKKVGEGVLSWKIMSVLSQPQCSLYERERQNDVREGERGRGRR